MLSLSGQKFQFAIETALDWCRAKISFNRRSEFGHCSDLDVERMARDVGMSVSELLSVAKRSKRGADALLRRMADLDLDPKEVSRKEPETLRDLQRLCTLCSYHRRCARDFARGAATDAWNDYCPNSGTLAALNTLPWSARQDW
jgi:hypothetical protein